jgi:hypothetical protein
MKLSLKTINILKNFSSINPSIIFHAGSVLRTSKVPGNNILARAVVAEEFPIEFGIYNLPQFISSLSMFESPELDFDDMRVIIRSSDKKDGDNRYITIYKSALNEKQFEDSKIVIPSFDASFDLANKNLQDILKGLNVLSLPEIAIVGDGSKIIIQAIDSKKNSSNSFSLVVGQTDKNFRSIIKADNLKLISDDYQVFIKTGACAYFKSKDLEYWIALSA